MHVWLCLLCFTPTKKKQKSKRLKPHREMARVKQNVKERARLGGLLFRWQDFVTAANVMMKAAPLQRGTENRGGEEGVCVYVCVCEGVCMCVCEGVCV